MPDYPQNPDDIARDMNPNGAELPVSYPPDYNNLVDAPAELTRQEADAIVDHLFKSVDVVGDFAIFDDPNGYYMIQIELDDGGVVRLFNHHNAEVFESMYGRDYDKEYDQHQQRKEADMDYHVKPYESAISKDAVDIFEDHSIDLANDLANKMVEKAKADAAEQTGNRRNYEPGDRLSYTVGVLSSMLKNSLYKVFEMRSNLQNLYNEFDQEEWKGWESAEELNDYLKDAIHRDIKFIERYLDNLQRTL